MWAGAVLSGSAKGRDCGCGRTGGWGEGGEVEGSKAKEKGSLVEQEFFIFIPIRFYRSRLQVKILTLYLKDPK